MNSTEAVEAAQNQVAERGAAKLITVLRECGIPDEGIVVALIGAGVTVARQMPSHQAVAAYLGEVSAAMSATPERSN